MNLYAKPYAHIDPYTYADPCADDGALEVAEAIVYGYTDDEIAERLTAWMAHWTTQSDVFEAWAEVIGDSIAEDKQDDIFLGYWADGSIRKFILPQLVSRNGGLWDKFAEHFTDIEVKALESGDDDYTGYGDD
jgi:hypothetical protein